MATPSTLTTAAPSTHLCPAADPGHGAPAGGCGSLGGAASCRPGRAGKRAAPAAGAAAGARGQGAAGAELCAGWQAWQLLVWHAPCSYCAVLTSCLPGACADRLQSDFLLAGVVIKLMQATAVRQPVRAACLQCWRAACSGIAQSHSGGADCLVSPACPLSFAERCQVGAVTLDIHLTSFLCPFFLMPLACAGRPGGGCLLL